MNMKYKVTIERKEIMREILEIEANSHLEAGDLAMEQIEEHDWADNTIVHGDENVVAIHKVQTAHVSGGKLTLIGSPLTSDEVLTLDIAEEDDTWVYYQSFDLHVHEGFVHVYKIGEYTEALYSVEII